MTTLRDYQQDLLDRVRNTLASAQNTRVMLQLPTGGGKTRIAGELLAAWPHNGRKAVWLTHRKELAAQTEGMLLETGVTATANMQWKPRTDAPTLINGVVILMAQTVSLRSRRKSVWDGYNHTDLLIIDEAHHATARGWARAINQWPGPVLGMTATPWRLSEREGFHHLFSDLHCGPQVAALQSDKWLCRSQVLSPPGEDRIQGGQVDTNGDFSESGIELANEDRDIWTAGALRFWKKHGENRQTVIYAVSVRHAQNLANMFNVAGIPAGLLLGDTPTEERARLIDHFQNRKIRALVNVAVATEGFDLPDAACVVLTRPTMSLSLYLQMVGRGLRPKHGDGDCVVLDLAGNSLRHGLPEEDREWSLRPRGQQPSGEAPLVRCPKCEGMSPASTHHCKHCGMSFGEPCDRCGAWRAWERWSGKNVCGYSHDLVCDLCHYDAHIQAQLPVTPEMEELAMFRDGDELAPNRDPFLKNLLEEERRRVVGGTEERKIELRLLIPKRESEPDDDSKRTELFDSYLKSLPLTERPSTFPQKAEMYIEWKKDREQELAEWKEELAKLEAQPVDMQLVYNKARERLMGLFEAEAGTAGLYPPIEQPSNTVSIDFGEGLPFYQLLPKFIELWGRRRPPVDPWCLQDPKGEQIAVNSWSSLLRETAEWLVREGLLHADSCPVTLGKATNRHVVHVSTEHVDGRGFQGPNKLTNGLYLENHWDPLDIARKVQQLVEKFGQDPREFRVWLR